MGFWDKVGDWFYDVTGHIETGLIFIIKIAFGLSIAAVILFAIYWVGKALLGFIKYYSQFA